VLSEMRSMLAKIISKKRNRLMAHLLTPNRYCDTHSKNVRRSLQKLLWTTGKKGFQEATEAFSPHLDLRSGKIATGIMLLDLEIVLTAI